VTSVEELELQIQLAALR